MSDNISHDTLNFNAAPDGLSPDEVLPPAPDLYDPEPEDTAPYEPLPDDPADGGTDFAGPEPEAQLPDPGLPDPGLSDPDLTFKLPESGLPSEKLPGERFNPLAIVFWILIALTPLISAWLLHFITGTGVQNLDAWNTTWNDEVGYYRVVELLRHDFFPKGMYGFNEDAPAHLAYGPYNIFTYLPYFALSFVTGISSHNFIYYSNAILAVLACVLFVVLARPRVLEGFFAFIFLSTHLIAGRYIWSGMSESSYNFFLILFTALALWMVRHPGSSARKQGWALGAMIAAVFFLNTMRPYYFPLLIIPVYFTFRKKSAFSARGKVLSLLFTVISAAASVGLFFFFTKYNVARYFFDSTQTEALGQLLKSGSPVVMVRQILHANKEALKEILGYIRNSRWAGVISILYFAQSALLLVVLIRSFFAREKARDGRCAVIFFMLAAGVAFYEANVVLYDPVQLHRMMLAVTISYGLMLAVLGSWERYAHQILLILLMAFLLVRAQENFRLPQIDSATLSAQEEQALTDEFAKILPLEEDPWDNTIAKLPETDMLQWEFMLPTYTSLNVCQKGVLEKLLTEKTIRSKFVLLSDTSDLNSICAANKYPVVWQGYGRTMYQVRQ